MFLDLLHNLVFNFHWIYLWTASQTGFYETRIAYYSWRGYKGYSYSRIPSYWGIVKEEHEGFPFWCCQGLGSTDWTTSPHHGAKKWHPCVYFNALYRFGQVRQLHYGLNARTYLRIPALLRQISFWFGPCFSPMDNLGTFFSLSPLLGSVVLELYKAAFGLQFQSEGNPFLFDLERMLLLSLFLFS
jgi:hypothetical protein